MVASCCEQRSRLRVADRLHVRRADAAFFENLDRRYSTAARLAVNRIASEIDFLALGKQIREVPLVGFTELPEVIPPTRDIGADVKHNNALVKRVARRVLLNGSHNPADKLNERAEVGEDAAHHRHGKIRVIKALAEHASLHDGIKLVILSC